MIRHQSFILLGAFLFFIGALRPVELFAVTLGKPHKASPEIVVEKEKPAKKEPKKKKVSPPKATPPPVKEKPKKVKKSPPPKAETKPPPTKSSDDIPRLSVGVAYTGAQVRYRFGRLLGVEVRYLRDSATSETGDLTADVLGGRLYLFSRPQKRFTFYGGGEGASISEKTKGSDQKIKGTALGGFAGIEYRIAKRFSWGMDVGLYNISLKKTTISAQESGTDFVINSFLNFHIF